jgi:hypothetical protein
MPFLLFPANEKDYWNFIEIKGASADREKLTNQIKYVWGRIAGETFLDYTFLEDKTALLYQKEQSMKRSLSIFSVIAIIISCLGLLGTVLNTTTEKTKEIGIRKVNGAQVQDVLYLLNKDFIYWILLSFLIAVPIALYLMNQWLQNFAYKTELSWWLFALSGILIMTIALLTVSFHSWKAASGNPVEAFHVNSFFIRTCKLNDRYGIKDQSCPKKNHSCNSWNSVKIDFQEKRYNQQHQGSNDIQQVSRFLNPSDRRKICCPLDSFRV